LANNAISRLKNFFNIDISDSSTVKNVDKVFPTRDKFDPKNPDKLLFDKSGSKIVAREVIPSKVQELLDWWINDVHYSQDSWKNRKALFKDCELMFLNSSIMARAADLVADEIVQSDSGTQPVLVEAKRKQKNFILEFFDKINLYDYIRPCGLKIAKYGNEGWILSFDEFGVDEIIPIKDIYSITDRLEFSPYVVEEMIKKNNNFFSTYRQKVNRIDQLATMIKNKDNIASYYKDYLFGFVINDDVLPPWRFLHFRNCPTESPIFPFGVPPFIHSLAAYMQYDSAMTLQIAARGANFPREVYKLTLPKSLPPSEKLQMAVTFANELQNSGINAVAKEKDGVGEVIISIADLYEYNIESPNIDLGRMGDIEALRDDLIISTYLPRNLLDPNDSAFGDSGISLIEKSRPFGRFIFGKQQIILQNLSQLIKIHMIHSNKFSLNEIDFVLKMPYPESQTNRDLVSSQSDQLRLATDVIDTLSDKFMNGDKLPPEIMRDIYTKFLPYGNEVIDAWLKTIEKSISNNGGDEVDQEVNEIKKNKLIERWIRIEKQHKEEIEDIIYDCKQNVLREGLMGGAHFYSSKNKYIDFPAEILREIDKRAIDKDENKSRQLKEELRGFKKYKFNKNKKG
jgi:hypothetical protein